MERGMSCWHLALSWWGVVVCCVEEERKGFGKGE